MRSVLVISLAIIYATASPIADSLVPEESLYTVVDELAEARQAITDMTNAGKSDKDCRKLVVEAKKEIEVTVSNNQKVIDALPRGDHCMALGQDIVKITTTQKNKADKHVDVCSKEVRKIESSHVDFGSRLFSSLTPGKCDSFYTSTAYTTTESKYEAARTAHTRAVGAANEASVALKNAISAASAEKHKCLCKTRQDHEKTFRASSAANGANTKAWVRAHQIECVLDHKKDCKAPACPRVKRAPLSAAAKEEQCK